MKKLLLSMTALSALAIAAPASAQYATNADFRVGIQRLQSRFDAGVRSGVINRAEAAPLRQQLGYLGTLERRYAAGGFTAQERANLQQRIRVLRRQIGIADGTAGGRFDRDRDGDDDRFDRNDDDRDDRFDRNRDGDDDRFDRDNDGRDDRFENRPRGRIDRNRDGYDDRDYDRDGRWNDDVVDRNRDGYDDRDYDRDGRWDDDAYERPRTGIGGFFDNLLGTGGLRVGSRDPGNLGGVPFEYRGAYRDGYDSYYRSDGRNVYQFDTRTRAVVRVYPVRR